MLGIKLRLLGKQKSLSRNFCILFALNIINNNIISYVWKKVVVVFFFIIINVSVG